MPAASDRVEFFALCFAADLDGQNFRIHPSFDSEWLGRPKPQVNVVPKNGCVAPDLSKRPGYDAAVGVPFNYLETRLQSRIIKRI